jgi:ubiquinol-cytochrome c reductase iron-sulfur subunit
MSASPPPPPAKDASDAEKREAQRLQELLDTRYMADLGPMDKGWGRREFLFISTVATGFAGLNFFVWPFLHSMNPAADVEALASTEVDLAPIQPGQAVTVVWRGKPVFIRHRTPEEIEAARRDDGAEMPQPETDQTRVQKAEWLVVIGVCNHLGCVPRGQRATDPQGEYGGWFCPCHGSHFDTSGRIRKGPAPSNLTVPQYAFLSDSRIRIG